MRLSGRRQSTNVDDRRSLGGVGKKSSMGIGGLIIAGIIYLIMGGDLSSFISNYASQAITIQGSDGGSYTATAEEEELAVFASQILAGTEDVWSAIFKNSGRTYRAPKLVLFSNRVQSGCGGATASTGPFYCSADQTVYIDLSFFTSMKRQIGADGDFAYAYVIAHEVGHHVQYLLGTLNQAYSKMNQVSERESNQISVRLELQADFFAGIWAHYDNKMFGSLEKGDIEEGLNVASKIGDDYLQKKAYGTTQPESFNHGTSAQRSRWLNKGITTGDLSAGDTFSVSYSSL
ncbi:MAG: neutral zinc metallopeptidase [Bacteroidales bacterium]|nr:neutral zinc metallopeptidase [Bacteroidales bacterium]